jgi:tetratricopeptide (TPR) repeat protein
MCERNSMTRSFPIGLFFVLLIGCAATIAIADDYAWPREKLLQYAWADSGIQPESTANLLRIAVKNNPHDIQLSAALIHVVGGDEADEVSRTALALNPGNPELLLARAKALRPSPALDVLAQLRQIPGHQVEADRLIERLSLGLTIPSAYELAQVYTYSQWADRLLYEGKLDRAAAVVDEGIAKLASGDRDARISLLGRRAILLALQKHFDDAMKIQKSFGFPQIEIQGKYVGLADVMLLMNQPALAIASFGGQSPPPSYDPEIRNSPDLDYHRRSVLRILAWAYAETGDVDRAEAILSADPEIPEKLLLIRLYLNNRKFDAASAIGDEITNAAVKEATRPFGARLLRVLPPDSSASLASTYIWSARWIMDHHPDQTIAIVEYVGSPSRALKHPARDLFTVLPSSQLIPKLYADLAAVRRGGQDGNSRWELIGALSDSHRYEEAAKIVSPLAVAPSVPWVWDEPRRINDNSVRWCILRRQADTESLFLRHPEMVESAYMLLNSAFDGSRTSTTSSSSGQAHFPSFISNLIGTRSRI